MDDKPTYKKRLAKTDYTIGWICALSIEVAASVGMLDEEHEDLDLAPGDRNMYTLGEIRWHNIVIACLPSGNMGITPAATVAADMLRSFPKIRFGLMVGIGGGAPSPRARPNEDVRLGDVVVSIPQGELGGVVKYDRGKVVNGGEFKHTGLLNMPPSLLTNAVAKLRGIHEKKRNLIARNITAMINKVRDSEDANPDFEDQYQCPGLEYDLLFDADYEHNESADLSTDARQEENTDDEDSDNISLPCRSCDKAKLVRRKQRKTTDPAIHYGIIASADQVMRHGATRERIRKQYSVLCFEMEAAGLMNDFPCLVVRGICDYSDTHKHKIWQRYAAATAAAYAKELLGIVLKEEIEKTEEVVKVLERHKQRQDYKKILNWLSMDTHMDRFIDSYKKWYSGTAQRFLHSEVYLNWANKNTETLWCYGIAGGGKTTFASVVVTNLKAEKPKTGIGIACLFCQYEKLKNETIQSLAAAILRQLADQCTAFPESVTALYDLHQVNRMPLRFEEISSALTKVLQSFSQVFLIVDALDECSEQARRELLSYIQEQQKRTKIKLLVTSRPTINVQQEFDSCEILEIMADEQDVKIVLSSLIERLPTFIRTDEMLRNRVKDDIAAAVDGMFVLVELFLDSLRGERSVGDLEDALTALTSSPDKASTVYERTLVRIGSQNPKDCELAHRTLSWIIESKRPLTRQELQHALAVKPRSLSFQKEYVFENVEEIVALCAGLVVINQSSNTVQLMHHTTRKYFEDYKNHLRWLTAAPGMIASICLTYVSFSVFASGPCCDDEELEERLFWYPLFRYAAEHWGNHTRDDQDQTSGVKELALKFLGDKARVNASNQVMNISERRYPGYSQSFTRDVNGLQTAASFGLANIMHGLIENGADTQAEDEEGRTALHRGAENGYGAVVSVALKYGADIDAKERKYGQTPLHLAALNGHMEVVQVLLEGGALPNVKDDDEWTAIHVAAWTGKEEVVRVLLEKSNVNETGRDELTALHCAAAQGHEAVVALLLEKNANVNAKDWGGWTPLHWASKKRHDVMNPRMLTIKDQPSKLLRQIVAQQEELKMVVQEQTIGLQDRAAALKSQLANMHGKLGWLPPVIGLDIDGKYHDVLATLNLVSDSQFLTLILPTASERMVERKPGPARLIFAIQDELTALHCMTECGHEGVARLLLKGGAEIKDKCRAKLETDFIYVGPTALHLAALSDHEAMVRMLLNRDADVHAGCETDLLHGLTGPLHTELSSLHFAILSGNERVVQLLIENGADVHAICVFGVQSRHFKISSLHAAVIRGDVKIVQLLLSNRVHINMRCEINFDIEDKDINQSSKLLTDLTPLHLAVLLERLEITRLLLENKADVQMQFSLKISTIRLHLTTLHVAIARKQNKIVQLLLQQGADVGTSLKVLENEKLKVEMTALHLTAPFKDMEIVRLLLEKGADVHATCHIDTNGWDPVQQTAEADTMKKAEIKDEKKVIDEQEPELGPMLSTQDFTTLSAEHLFGQFFSPHGRDPAGSSTGSKTESASQMHFDESYMVHTELKMVHLAAVFSKDELVKVLLENGADPNAQMILAIGKAYQDNFVTPLHLAVIWGNERMLNLLLDAGASIYAKLDIHLGDWLHIEATVLQLAVIFGNEEIVRAILENGNDNIHLEGQINLGWVQIKLTALHLAVLLQQDRKTSLLLEHGANVEEWFSLDVEDNHVQFRVIHFAAATGSPDVMQLLLDNGSDACDVCQINNDPDNKITPLHFAAMFNNMEAMLLLIKNRANVSSNCRVKLDPWLDVHLSTLQLVALWGNLDIVESLLEGGSDVHLKGNIRFIKAKAEISDLTVLHVAAMWDHHRGMEQLLEAQCDVDAKVRIAIDSMLYTDLSPLHIAALRNHHGMVRMLLEKGPDSDSKIQIKGPYDTHLELTALNLAGMWNNEIMAHALLDSGAEPNSRCEMKTGESNISINTLHLAGSWNNEMIVQALLDCGAEPDKKCHIYTHKFSASINNMHLAGISNNERIVQTLLDYGADANAWCQIDIAGSSVSINTLHLAAAWGNKRMMRILLSTAPRNVSENFLSASSSRSSSAPSSSSFIPTSVNECSRKRPHEVSRDESFEKPNKRISIADVNAIFLLNLGSTVTELAAIHLAALKGSTQMIQLMCDNGADVNLAFGVYSRHKHFEITPLHLAVLWQSQEMTKYLLERKANVHAKFRVVGNNIHAEFSALHLAVLCRNSAGVAALLVVNHLDLNEKCHIGVYGKFQIELTLLHLAACVGQEGIADLLKKGVDPSTKSLANIRLCTPYELTALDLAKLFKNELFSMILLEAGAIDQPVTHAKQLAPLLAALLSYNVGLTRSSLDLIDDLDENFTLTINANIETAFAIPLHASAGATFNIKIEVEMSILHIAAALGLVDVVSSLIQRGVCLETKCRVKVHDALYAEFTALHLASMLKHDELLYLLLGKGSEIQAMSQIAIQRTVQAGFIASYLTTLSGQEGFLRFLKKSTDIEVNVKAQLTSLHLAALLDDNVVAYLILYEGTDIDAVCIVNVEAKTQGNSETNIEAQLTALHIAVGAGHERMVQLLVEKGADIDLTVQMSGAVAVNRGAQIHRKIRAGGTALHIAARTGNEKIAQILIDNGADINAKGQDGRTALKWARIQGHDMVAQLILEQRAQLILELRAKGQKESASRDNGRALQKLRKVFSKEDSAMDIGREDNFQDNGNEAERSEVNQNPGRNITPFLKRFVVEKAEEHLQKMRRGLFAKRTHISSVKTQDSSNAGQNADDESAIHKTGDEDLAID